jgi:hypothetical protein
MSWNSAIFDCLLFLIDTPMGLHVEVARGSSVHRQRANPLTKDGPRGSEGFSFWKFANSPRHRQTQASKQNRRHLHTFPKFTTNNDLARPCYHQFYSRRLQGSANLPWWAPSAPLELADLPQPVSPAASHQSHQSEPLTTFHPHRHRRNETSPRAHCRAYLIRTVHRGPNRPVSTGRCRRLSMPANPLRPGPAQ